MGSKSSQPYLKHTVSFLLQGLEESLDWKTVLVLVKIDLVVVIAIRGEGVRRRKSGVIELVPRSQKFPKYFLVFFWGC